MITDISTLTDIATDIFSIRTITYYFIFIIPISLVFYIICAYKISRNQELLSQIKTLPPSEHLWMLKKKLNNASFSVEIFPEIWIKKQIRYHYCIAFTITLWLVISIAAAVFLFWGKDSSGIDQLVVTPTR